MKSIMRIRTKVCHLRNLCIFFESISKAGWVFSLILGLIALRGKFCSDESPQNLRSAKISSPLCILSMMKYYSSEFPICNFVLSLLQSQNILHIIEPG